MSTDFSDLGNACGSGFAFMNLQNAPNLAAVQAFFFGLKALKHG
jgi:hypothetical protein